VIRIVNSLSITVLSKMMGATEALRHRATAVWQGSHVNVELFGANREGDEFVYMLTDTFAGAGGARAFADGVDLGGEIPNVVSRWANVESEELNTPVNYLYRRAVPDSGGAGKYRGGLAHEFAIVAAEAAGDTLGTVLFGTGLRSPIAHGVFGGYPGCQVDYLMFRDANAAELPRSLQATRGERVESVPWGEFDLRQGDILYCRNNAGGGYGDPLDRDPALVAQDVRTGHVTAAAARAVYGVVLAGDGTADDAATDAERREGRSARLGGSELRRAPGDGSPAAGALRIGEYLLLLPDGSTTCHACGERLCGDGEDWKDRVPGALRPLSAGGSNRPDDDELALREFYCPGCATLLDLEISRASDPPLYDRVAVPPR
jgi:N-methylhydantoinase B